MSIVHPGTQPPELQESTHLLKQHTAQLTIKPGIRRAMAQAHKQASTQGRKHAGTSRCASDHTHERVMTKCACDLSMAAGPSEVPRPRQAGCCDSEHMPSSQVA
eukprot:4349013-Alexandrium_andersonii.AAC.1